MLGTPSKYESRGLQKEPTMLHNVVRFESLFLVLKEVQEQYNSYYFHSLNNCSFLRVLAGVFIIA